MKPVKSKKKLAAYVAMSPNKSLRDSTGQAGGVIKRKPRVFVAMSGGVDSSVAALLLKKQGYDVTGVFMKNWSEESFAGKFKGACPWKKDQADARKVCEKLKVPFRVYNFEKEYAAKVIDVFFSGERRGLTPNPDVICNREIKFGLFLKRAISDGADFIATGHYARLRVKQQNFIPHSASGHPLRFRRGIKGEVESNADRLTYQLLQATDKNKDQTYFLCLLTQRQLARTLFPLADLTKPEVREIARDAGLVTAEKPESMGICFVGEIKMEDFLKARIKETPGKIKSAEGKILGLHKGLPFYTIGQRQGLNLGGGVPYYVVAKNVRTNVLVVAAGSDHKRLYQKKAAINKINWISGSPEKFPFRCSVRIRHRQELQKAILKKQKKIFIVEFEKKQRAITSGQYCAIYKSNCLLGGAVIL